MSRIGRLHIDMLEGIHLHERDPTDRACGDDLFCTRDHRIKMSVVRDA
jgi:hypothetical protein